MAAVMRRITLLVFVTVFVETATSLPPGIGSQSAGPFTGFQVLEIKMNSTHENRKFLSHLQSKHEADVWGWQAHGTVDVMVGPTHLNDVIEMLKGNATSYRIKIPDVQTLLDEHLSDNHSRFRRSVSLSSVRRRYLNLSQIRQFLQRIRREATQADVSLANLGHSVQGRSTPYVRIRQKNSRNRNRPLIIVDAGIHAREWIAPAMALNMIYILSVNPDDDRDVEELLEKFDWLIIPVLNPDGYVFSHANSSTRLWRKTRTTAYARDPRCLGVDANRNFGYQWSDSIGNGGNNNPCEDNYSGPYGFSEPETRNLKALLDLERGRTAAYISLHSYGQFFLYPWGYDPFARIDDEEDLQQVARNFSYAMLRRNRRYEVGSSAKVLYAAAGASDDYARGGAGVKFAFTVELSPTDSSPHGFLLPAHHISSVVSDHWPAFKAMARAIWTKMQDGNNSNNFSNSHNVNDSAFQLDDVEEDDNNHGNDEQDTHEDADGGYDGDDDGDDTHYGYDGRTSDSAAAGRGRGHNSNSGGLTSVTIDGHTYRLDLSDPVTYSWVRYYLHLFGLRRAWNGA